MALTQVQSGLLGSDAQALSFRNRIINGDMRIAQRGTSFAGINTTAAYYAADRFRFSCNNPSSIWTFSQETDAPAGFSNSIKMLCTTGASYSSTHEAYVEQLVEGYTVSDIGFGTSSASPLTLSFWVKASSAGTYGIWILETNDTRGICSSYTVNAPGTWEYKSVTIPGDVASSINVTNGMALRVRYYIDSGSGNRGTINTSWHTVSGQPRMPTAAPSPGSVTGGYVQLTGVQLEKGTVATAFENRPYGTELALCQRYFNKSFSQQYAPQNGSGGGSGIQISVAAGHDPQMWVSFPVEMRASPSTALYNPYVSSPAGQWYGAAFAGGSGANARALAVTTRGMSIDNTDYGASNTGWCEIHYAVSAEL